MNTPAMQNDTHTDAHDGTRHHETRCSVCTHAARDEIDRQLGSGRELREIAKEFGLSTTAAHRHHRLHVPEARQAPPARPTPPRRFSGCPICQAHPDMFAAVNRVLSVGVPDVARVANRFDFQESAVLAHWRHAAETLPPAPAAPRPVPVEVEPLAETTIEEAGALLREQPLALVRARNEMLNAYNKARRVADGVGAEVADIEMLVFRSRTRGQSHAGALLIYRAAEHRFAELAAEDPRKLAGAAAQLRQARIAANAPPTVAFDAGAFLRSLADRGVVLHPLEGERFAVRGALSPADRARIAAHRVEIARFLTVVETI